MIKRNFFIAATTILTLLTLVGCKTVSDTPDTPDTPEAQITIGYMGALSGGLASTGKDEQRAIELAFGSNFTVNGAAIKLVNEDSKCDATAAITAAQKLITTDKVEVILGGLCSSETLAAAPIANEKGVILFSSASISPEVTDAGEYVFRNAPSEALITKVLAESIASKHRQVAIISENTDFSQAYRGELITMLADANVEILVDEVFSPDTKDFKTILQKVKDSPATALINLAQTSKSAGLIAKQAAVVGVETQQYGTDAMTGKEFLSIARNAAEGIQIVMVGVSLNNPRVQEFIANYELSYDEKPASTTYAALSYDRAQILKMALEEVGNDADALKTYLEEMPAYQGLGGLTGFDENGDSSLRPILHEFVDGEVVAAE